MIRRNRQPRAAGWVEAPLEHITLNEERAGNAALEELAAAMLVRRDKFPWVHNLALAQLYPTSQMLAEFISFGCSPNKAVVGANAFAHESGIHQHGMMANPLTYEIMTPESVGVSSTNLVLGKHSGRRLLEQRLPKSNCFFGPNREL